MLTVTQDDTVRPIDLGNEIVYVVDRGSHAEVWDECWDSRLFTLSPGASDEVIGDAVKVFNRAYELGRIAGRDEIKHEMKKLLDINS